MTEYTPCYPKHTWDIVKDDIAAFEKDMEAIRERAIANGADMAMLIEARHVATDERVTLKCRIPLCESYGQCLMDPPYSPTAEETAKVIAKYKYAILTEVSMPLPKELWDFIQTKDLPLCRYKDEKLAIEYEQQTQIPLWFRLHEIVMEIERQAHNLGYFFAVGYVASTCYLCYDASNPATHCDTSSPCKRPYEARPSMEAAGIDVFGTYHNVGLKLKMASMEKLSWSGLVLVV